MTNASDILGRKPAHKPRAEPDDRLPDEDWRGEHHWKIKRGEGSGNGSFSTSGAVRKAAKIKGRA